MRLVPRESITPMPMPPPTDRIYYYAPYIPAVLHRYPPDGTTIVLPEIRNIQFPKFDVGSFKSVYPMDIEDRRGKEGETIV